MLLGHVRAQASLLLTDPPYGVSVGERNADTGMGQARPIMNDALDALGMSKLWVDSFRQAYRACGPKASFYTFAPRGGPLMRAICEALRQAGWEDRHELVWVKARFAMGRCDYHYRHETILYGWKAKESHAWLGGRKQDSVLEFGRDTKGLDHPTQKPKALLKRLIENHCGKGEWVLDPFLGSGSTLMACELSGTRCMGMELDPHYAGETIRRWEKFTDQKAQRI
jgi:site-specific DNA-methyltransferase (adenine-specific)